MPMKRSSFLWGLVVVVAALAGFWVAQRSAGSAPQLTSGTWFPQPRPIGDFALTDERSQPFTLASLKGRPTLVFFGFTHCPDVCPTTLALLASVQKRVAMPNLKVALISVDPERDTPEQLGSYIASFRGDLIGLTGSASEIVKATRAFGVAAARVDLGGGNYTMDHSAAVFVLDSRARIVAVFTPPLSAPALSRDLARLAPVLNPRA